MEDNRLFNKGNAANSLQISVIGTVTAGASFKIGDGEAFLLKNITEDNISVEIVPYSQEESVTTILYPGWNVELVKEVKNAKANTLQYGY